jgi:hypothetical protein
VVVVVVPIAIVVDHHARSARRVRSSALRLAWSMIVLHAEVMIATSSTSSVSCTSGEAEMLPTTPLPYRHCCHARRSQTARVWCCFHGDHDCDRDRDRDWDRDLAALKTRAIALQAQA